MHDIELEGYFKIEAKMMYLFLELKSQPCIRMVQTKSATWKECKHEHLGAAFVSSFSVFYLHFQQK